MMKWTKWDEVRLRVPDSKKAVSCYLTGGRRRPRRNEVVQRHGFRGGGQSIGVPGRQSIGFRGKQSIGFWRARGGSLLGSGEAVSLLGFGEAVSLLGSVGGGGGLSIYWVPRRLSSTGFRGGGQSVSLLGSGWGGGGCCQSIGFRGGGQSI